MSKNNYKPLGDYIEQVNIRNRELLDVPLLGVSVQKIFIPSIANTVGTDFSKYKVLEKNQFTYIADTSRRGDKIGVAHLKDYDKALVSQAYTTFKITNEEKLNSDYLMMWFVRPEFDRYARYHSYGSVREVFDWDAMCNVMLPVPPIEEQQKIVAQYQAVENKIKTNEQICEKLEETAQAIYKEWFVDFNFPNEDGKPYKDNGGKMVWNDELEKEVPAGWEVKELSEISTITMGQSPSGESYNEDGIGEVFYQGRTDFGYRIPSIRMFTTEPKRMAEKGDVLMSVRAPVGDLNITNNNCCIGRGLASIRSKESSYTFYLLKDFKTYFDLSEGTGTIFSSITKEELHKLNFIYNNKTAILFNSLIKNIDNIIISKSKLNIKLSELKELLLTRLVK